MADCYEESIDKLNLYNELLLQENARLEKIIALLEEKIIRLEQTKEEMKQQLDITVDLANQRWKELDKLKRQYSFDRYTTKYSGGENVE